VALVGYTQKCTTGDRLRWRPVAEHQAVARAEQAAAADRPARPLGRLVEREHARGGVAVERDDDRRVAFPGAHLACGAVDGRCDVAPALRVARAVGEARARHAECERVQQRGVAEQREPHRRSERARGEAARGARVALGRERDERRRGGQQREPRGARPVQLRHVREREHGEDRERRARAEEREQEAALAGAARRAALERGAHRRARKRDERGEHRRREQHSDGAEQPVQCELGGVVDPPRALEQERRPVVLRVPRDDGREERERHDGGEPELGPRERRARPPVDEHESQGAGAEQRDGVLRQQPQPEAHAGAPPRARPRLDQGAPEEVERTGPCRRERRIGRHDDAARERERQHRDERQRHGGRRLAEPTARERGAEAGRDERAQDRARAHAPFAVAERARAEPNEPGDERRMIEIGELQVSRVTPVVRLFGEELEGTGVGDAQREQVAQRGQAAEAQRQRPLLRSALGRQHPERRADRRDRQTEQRARHERRHGRSPAAAQQALERTAAQERRERAEGGEPEHASRPELAREQSRHGGERGGRARQLRRADGGARALQRCEHAHVEHGRCRQRDQEPAQDRRVHVRTREGGQPREILADLGGAELRLPLHAVGERDRHFERAQARAAAREQLEQDLEAGGRLAQVEQRLAARGEEARHRIAHHRDRPGKRRSQLRNDAPVQRPAADCAAAHVPAADGDVGAAIEHRARERGHRFGRVRQVGVHDDDDVRASFAGAEDHRAREPARAAPDHRAHRVTRRPSGDALGRAVLRVVVDHHDLERRRAVEREDAPQQLVDVQRLVQRGHDDGERRLHQRRPAASWRSRSTATADTAACRL